jgi:hypothetical protein
MQKSHASLSDFREARPTVPATPVAILVTIFMH